MQNNNRILLDAQLLNMVDNTAFRAELRNGHQIVAFLKKSEKDEIGDLEPGDGVSVAMSPYNMSVGRILRKIKQDEALS